MIVLLGVYAFALSIRPSLPLAASSVADVGIAGALALGGVAMAPLPAGDIAATLAAAGLFALALDVVKRPVFARLGLS